MKFTKFFLSVISITGIMALSSVCAVAAQSASQQTAASQEVAQTNTSAELEQYFQKAHEAYSKNATEAAAEIRKATALLKQEANNAKGEARQLLLESSKELGGLADQVQKGTVKTAQDLDNAFSRAQTALASYYQQRAQNSWTKKAISDVGQSLNAAALNLEGAWKWSKTRAEKASQAAVNSAKVVSEKIAKGSGWAQKSARASMTWEGKSESCAAKRREMIPPTRFPPYLQERQKPLLKALSQRSCRWPRPTSRLWCTLR
jgi:hypothetical protein